MQGTEGETGIKENRARVIKNACGAGSSKTAWRHKMEWIQMELICGSGAE